jgi:hypothetical protein
MKRALIVCLLLLQACGVDGAPTAPEPGVTISGTAQMGIAKNGSDQ